MLKCVFLLLPALISSYQIYDPSVAERFPLSGGLKTGMEVEIKIQGYALENSKFDFVTPAGDVVFSFELMSGSEPKTVKRTSGGQNSTFGAWPLGVNSSTHTFKFRVHNNTLMTYIDDKYMPWFNSQDLGTDLVVHVWVFAGLEKPEVTISRPACTTACSVDECTNIWGRSMCVDENGTNMDASYCTVSELGYDSYATRCVKASGALSARSVCCSGTARPLNQLEYSKDTYKWLEVINDQALIKRSCEALGVASCDFTPASVYLECTNITSGGTIKCTYPSDIEAPVSAFQVPPLKIVNFTLTKSEAASTQITWPAERPFYFPVTDSPKASLKGMYLFTMHALEVGKSHDPWKPLTKDRWNYWATDADKKAVGILALASNVPAPVDLLLQDINLTADSSQQCSGQDDCVAWEDINGNNCTSYKEKGWCTTDGKATEAFKQANECADGNLYSKCLFKPGSIKWGAPVPCVACGGGGYGGARDKLPDKFAELDPYVSMG